MLCLSWYIESAPYLNIWIAYINTLSRFSVPYLKYMHCLSFYITQLYPILIHWTELYPILIHWAELYPILIHWSEYTLISAIRVVSQSVSSITSPESSANQNRVLHHSAANQIRVLRNPSRQPIRIEYYITRQPIKFEYYVTGVVSQSESSITSPESSRLGSGSLLGSWLAIADLIT